MSTIKPADQTITWADGFAQYSAVITDGIISEYKHSTLIGQWAATRAECYDGHECREEFAFDTGADSVEYACGPVDEGDVVAWINGAAYVLTQTGVGAAIPADAEEVGTQR